MPQIGTLIDFVGLTKIVSSDVDQNFADIRTAFNDSAVLTDVAKTISVTHTFQASQTFSGGASFGAAVTMTSTLEVTGELTASAGVKVTGGSTGAGKIIVGSVSGLYLQGATGTSRDFAIATPAGAIVAEVPTGTTSWTLGGSLNWTTAVNGIVNAPASMLFNVDSDNNNTGEAIIFGANRTGTTGGTELGRMTETGIFAWGTTVTSGASAGDVVMKYGAAHRFVDKAGTVTVPLVDLATIGVVDNVVRIAPGGGNRVSIGGAIVDGAVGGDLVLGSAKYLRSANAAGTGTNQLIGTDSGDHVYIGVNSTANIYFNHAGGSRFMFGTSVTTNSSAGDLVLANAKALRGVNAAGTSTLAMVAQVSGTNLVGLGYSSSHSDFGVLADTGAAGSGETALLLIVNDGAVTSRRRVTVGAADSGGVGYRYLRVAN